MSKRCARERSRNSTRPFLDADGYLLGLHGFASRRFPQIWYPTISHCPDKFGGI
jgi:hypothetical protein